MPNLTPVNFNPFLEDREIEKIVYTNDSQREIWLACIFGGDEANLAYNESISLHIQGILQLDHFKTALANLVLRHEALRATISPNGEMLVVYRNLPAPLVILDISHLNQTQQKTEISEYIAKEMAIPLSLKDGPLFKLYIHKLAHDRHLFTMIKHHVIADGWSSGIMLEDLSKMYNAYIKGHTITLFKADQLSDYALVQTKFKAGKGFKETEEYWLNVYRGPIPVVDLPTDHPRTSPRSYQGMRLDYPMGKELLDELKKKGAKVGASLVTTLLAAFEVFLYSKTRQETLVIGLPSSGQSASGLFNVVGHCVNLLPLKTTIDEKSTFAAYLRKRKSEVLDAYDHQRLTFGELIKKLYIQRDSSRITLVPVIFNIDMGMDQQVKFDGLEHHLISNPRAYETFDLYLNITGSKQGALLEWSFNTGLFNPETIVGFNHDYQQIIQQIIKNPDLSISDLYPSPQIQPSSAQVQNSIPLLDVKKNVIELLNDAVTSYSNKIAVQYKDNQLSYAAVASQSDLLAQFFTDKGVKKGDIIALSITRSPGMLIALLGILKAGAAYLPLDPEFPKDRIEFMLQDAGAKLLVLSATYKGTYQTDATEIIIEEMMSFNPPVASLAPQLTLDATDLAYILYTSGSTGKPKGVQITHHNLANFLVSMRNEPGISQKDTLLAITTISFDIAGLELYLPLIAGAKLMIAEAEATKDSRLLVDLLQHHPITMMQATPSTWQMMIDAGWLGKPGLKALTGGEALPKALADQLLLRVDSLWNMYGPTETTIWSSLKQINKTDQIINIGKPILNTSMYIMDELGNELPVGETGEIAIGGDGVAKGYLNRPELNIEKFIASRKSGIEGKIYKTGDLGKVLENGEFVCLGRIDQQVKIRGHRIELGEIESLLDHQKEIKQSVVVAREDQPGDQHLVAYVILEDQSSAEGEDTLSWHERWETLYSIGVEVNDQAQDAHQDLDGTLLNYYENGADLAQQSAEWLQSSVARIKKLGSKRIYEIGSGAGQVLYELAPGIDYYVATDYSPTAIDKLNEKLMSDKQRWGHVKAKVANADDFSQVSEDRFDLVLIHSVAQYFPDDHYLIDVIKKAIVALEGNGQIFIGDMQGKNTLEMCHAIDYLPRAPEESSLSQFRKVIANRVGIDDELIADPDFFYALPQLIPEIKHVDIQLRKGKSLNETTKYHYDICLYIGKKPALYAPELFLNYQNSTTITDIEALLYQHPDRVIEISNILNNRTAKDLQLLHLMYTAEASMSLSQVRQQLELAPSGLHPDLFWEMATRFHFEAHVRWTSDGSDGCFNVIFVPSAFKGLPDVAINAQGKLIHEYSKIPFSKKDLQLPAALIEQWKSRLASSLPSYMIPDEFVALKSFPLTPNAKIDKKALPRPITQRSKPVEKGGHPVTEQEKLVASIWTEVLGHDDFTINDDFFQLGGHSLLAMKVMIAIEKETGKRLPLAIFFDNSTIETMARRLKDEQPKSSFDAIVPIKTQGTKSPVFLIHGGGLQVLLFKTLSSYFDDDQPVYGIQALGLNREMEIPQRLEDIASIYVDEMLRVDPVGPYSIAGYSLGGFFACEMARQLQLRGKTLKMVGIIDTYASTGEKLNSSEQVMKKIRRQFYKVPFFINSFQKYPQETIAYQTKILKHKFSKAKTQDAMVEDTMLTPYQLSIYENYSRALKNYELTTFNIKVTLFRVQKRLYYLDDSVYLGWNNYALKGVEIVEVPGDHKTFLYPPNDKAFAKVFQDTLNEKS